MITAFTGAIPEVSVTALILMVLGGLLGGVTGRMINKRIDAQAVDKLFIRLMAAIILICIYNAV